jgi:uncharacterized Zn finger protein (UPF0148 family)
LHEGGGIGLAAIINVPTDTCPLCGTAVALLRSQQRRSGAEVLRRRIATLRERAEDLEEGEIAPRQLKDDVLWMCPDCQRVMTDLPRLDRQEIQRRINEQARQLERKLAVLTRRAG